MGTASIDAVEVAVGGAAAAELDRPGDEGTDDGDRGPVGVGEVQGGGSGPGR